MKKCTKCGTVKPLDEFYRQARNKDGRSNDCGDCRRRYNLEKYHQNKNATNPKRNRQRRETKSYKDYSLRQRYGITVEQYETLRQQQDGCCAICKQAEQQRDARYGTLLDLAVDHDHNTGEIRGLLCSACNTAIGKFNDDPQLLREAIRYLEMRKPPTEAGG